MLTERIDRALNALNACRSSLPGLRDVYRPESRERVALEKLLAVIAETDEALTEYRSLPARAERP